MIRKHIKRIGLKIADFLLPPLCPATGEAVDIIGMFSPDYWQKINFINAPFCEKCGSPFAFEASHLSCGHCIEHPPIFHHNRSAIAYDDHSRQIILRFKHGDQTHAVKAFTPWLRQAGADLLQNTDIICPVPLHRFRLIKRRYNQSDLMARDIAKHYPDIHYIPDLILRTKNTLPQGHKNAKDRQKNIRHAFIINPKYNIDSKRILIIDDVFTTGATLNECAKTLYQSKASLANTLTLAKVVKD